MYSVKNGFEDIENIEYGDCVNFNDGIETNVSINCLDFIDNYSVLGDCL